MLCYVTLHMVYMMKNELLLLKRHTKRGKMQDKKLIVKLVTYK